MKSRTRSSSTERRKIRSSTRTPSSKKSKIRSSKKSKPRSSTRTHRSKRSKTLSPRKVEDWKEPYNIPNERACPNCTLNSCLACDEKISGPIFKKVAARTRRDSGLTSAIWRPLSSIAEITHYYY